MKVRAFAGALVLLATPGVATAGVSSERPNIVAVEAGGRGLFFSVQYERWFNDWVSIGGGFTALPCVECGASSPGTPQDYLLLIVPAWASVGLPLADVHSVVP